LAGHRPRLSRAEVAIFRAGPATRYAGRPNVPLAEDPAGLLKQKGQIFRSAPGVLLMAAFLAYISASSEAVHDGCLSVLPTTPHI